MGDEGASLREAAFDYRHWEAQLPELRRKYATASPFPHVVPADFLAPDAVRGAAMEFPEVDSEWWIGYLHVNERKFGNTDVDAFHSHPETRSPARLRCRASRSPFLHKLERLRFRRKRDEV